jgi:hypothetical protein
MKELFSSASKVGGTPITRDPSGKEVFAINDYIEKASVMESSNPSSTIEPKPIEPKPIEQKPPLNNSSTSGNTVIECPALLCD